MFANRRQFLASVLGAAIGGTTISISKAALADPILGRYAMTVELQRKVYKTNARYKEQLAKERETNPLVRNYVKDSGSKLLRTLKVLVDEQSDVLLKYMLENFDGEHDLEASYQIDDLFTARLKPDTMSIADLQKLLDVVIPVAVMKTLLGKERVAFNTNTSTHMLPFVSRYKELILGRPARPRDQVIAMFPEWAKANGFRLS